MVYRFDFLECPIWRTRLTQHVQQQYNTHTQIPVYKARHTISVTILRLYSLKSSSRDWDDPFSCCCQRWLRINKCTKFRHKREKGEGRRRNRNRNKKMMIKTPNVVKIAFLGPDDTNFCAGGGGLFFFLLGSCVRAWVLVIHVNQFQFQGSRVLPGLLYMDAALLFFLSLPFSFSPPPGHLFLWLSWLPADITFVSQFRFRFQLCHRT